MLEVKSNKKSTKLCEVKSTIFYKTVCLAQIHKICTLILSRPNFLAQYTWDLTESSGRASGYITDLISFLQSTFISFTNLPVKLKHQRQICLEF